VQVRRGAAVAPSVKIFSVVIAAVASAVSIANAQTVGFGGSSGCAGKPSTTEPYLFYDGKKLIMATTTCTLTPLPNSRVTAQCEGGPQGKYTEQYTLIVTATSVQIFRESGLRLIGLPVCL
jgi:hypothetical protein